MPPCKQFRDSLLDMSENELVGQSKTDLRKHVEICPHCSRFLTQMMRLRSHLTGMEQVSTSENFNILLRERIRRELGRKQSRRNSMATVGRWAPVLGFSILLIVAGFWMLDGDSAKTSPLQPPVILSEESQDDPVAETTPVQYVIDDYSTNYVASENPEETRLHAQSLDSIPEVRELNRVQAPITQVSF